MLFCVCSHCGVTLYFPLNILFDRPLVRVLMSVYPVHSWDLVENAWDGNSHCGHHDVGLSWCSLSLPASEWSYFPHSVFSSVFISNKSLCSHCHTEVLRNTKGRSRLGNWVFSWVQMVIRVNRCEIFLFSCFHSCIQPKSTSLSWKYQIQKRALKTFREKSLIAVKLITQSIFPILNTSGPSLGPNLSVDPFIWFLCVSSLHPLGSPSVFIRMHARVQSQRGKRREKRSWKKPRFPHHGPDISFWFSMCLFWFSGGTTYLRENYNSPVLVLSLWERHSDKNRELFFWKGSWSLKCVSPGFAVD